MMLPAARAGDGHAPFLTALFTATSAVCVTGLTVVDTATYWSGLRPRRDHRCSSRSAGSASSPPRPCSRWSSRNRLGIRTRLLAQAEGRSLGLANVRQVLHPGRASPWLVCEAVIAARPDRPGSGSPTTCGFFTSLWYGVFHAVSAFNNAGFALYSDSLIGFVGDWWICLPITVGVIARQRRLPGRCSNWPGEPRRPSTWSTHTRLTVVGTIGLLVHRLRS